MSGGIRSGDLEMWAGVECTVNRVGDRTFDQLALTGHDRRPDDPDRLAALGVKALRYPVLWERHRDESDWAASDLRLARLRELGIRPILGLVHHGSGPRHTCLTDDGFADGLAEFAGRVAARYPWVDAYTPVNEPLTTARFSGLYGHWYPHGRDDRTFARCLLNQCRAVARAMKAVRRVRPDAKLIQTEDLGQVFATPNLADQAAFENERRWVSWDLLFGRVGRGHPLGEFLRAAGATDRELGEFRDAPCPPDVIGINHYVTSDRFLDDRLHLYPGRSCDGNGRQRYVDTEAVRVLRHGGAGVKSLIGQTWRRYWRPVAVTEAHLGCTPDEQVRWLHDVWCAARDARREGADVRAVTAWSAFGCYHWDALVTRETGHYESGLFDARTDPPTPTPLAELVRELANGQTPSSPALSTPGWWARPDRLIHEYEGIPAAGPSRPAYPRNPNHPASPGLVSETVRFR